MLQLLRSVNMVVLLYIPLANQHHHYIAMPHWPSPLEASWEVAAILCKLTPVTYFI